MKRFASRFAAEPWRICWRLQPYGSMPAPADKRRELERCVNARLARHQLERGGDVGRLDRPSLATFARFFDGRLPVLLEHAFDVRRSSAPAYNPICPPSMHG